MACNNQETLTAQDITDVTENIKAVNEWVEGGSNTTVVMGGQNVPSPLKLITDAKLYKPPLAWPGAGTVTDATQPYIGTDDIIYAANPALLPLTVTGTFATDIAVANAWYVVTLQRPIKVVEEILDLLNESGSITYNVSVNSYNTPLYATITPFDGGGGEFAWDATLPKTNANFGTIFDPSVSLANQGTGVGNGCHVRVADGSGIKAVWWGIVLDGVTDGTIAIQNALNYSDSLVISPQGAPTVMLPAGKIACGELTRDHASLEGDNTFGTTIVYNGAEGGTWVLDGAATKKYIRKIRTIVGATAPGIWWDATTTLMDWGTFLEEVYFGPLSLTLGVTNVSMGEIVNQYWNNVRLSAAPDLVKIKQGTTGSSNRVFSISDFTIDFGSTMAVESIVKVDMTGSAYLTVSLSNARLESTTAMSATNPAIVKITDTVGPNNIAATGINLVAENIGIQIDGTNNPALLYQDTTQTNVTSAINLKNVFMDGLATIHGGSWSAFFPTPEPLSFPFTAFCWISGRTNDKNMVLPLVVYAGKQFTFDNGIKIITGSGTPEGVETAPPGSTFQRLDGGSGFHKYVKDTGTGNTGWILG